MQQETKLNVTGTWLICDTEKKCTPDNGMMYVMCRLGKGQFFTSLRRGTKPVGEFIYHLEGENMTTWEISEDKKDTVTTQIAVEIIDEDKMKWQVQDGNTLYLFREQETVKF